MNVGESLERYFESNYVAAMFLMNGGAKLNTNAKLNKVLRSVLAISAFGSLILFPSILRAEELSLIPSLLFVTQLQNSLGSLLMGASMYLFMLSSCCLVVSNSRQPWITVASSSLLFAFGIYSLRSLLAFF